LTSYTVGRSPGGREHGKEKMLLIIYNEISLRFTDGNERINTETAEPPPSKGQE